MRFGFCGLELTLLGLGFANCGLGFGDNGLGFGVLHYLKTLRVQLQHLHYTSLHRECITGRGEISKQKEKRGRNA
jgi:hypothetical protein